MTGFAENCEKEGMNWCSECKGFRTKCEHMVEKKLQEAHDARMGYDDFRGIRQD